MARKLVPVLVVLFLGAAGSAVYFKISYDDVKRRLDQAEAKLQQEKRERKASEDRQATLLAERDRQIKQLQAIEREYNRLKEEVLAPLRETLKKREAELEDLAGRYKALQKQEAELRATVQRLTKQLEEQIALRNELMPKLKETEAVVSRLKVELAGEQRAKAQIQQKLTAALDQLQKAQTELERLKKLAPDLAGKHITGKVTEVVAGDKIIIGDLNEPPEVGLEFSVFRGSQFVARARVYRVFEKFAGASITFLQEGKEVRPGDVVKTGFRAGSERTQKAR